MQIGNRVEVRVMNEIFDAKSRPLLGALNKSRLVFIRDLEIDAVIGVFPHEKENPQRIIIGAELRVTDDAADIDDQLDNVVCYGGVIDLIKSVCSEGHVNLLETLAENIAQRALENPRVLAMRISIEKPDIFDDCAGVGIAIERFQVPR